MSDNETPAGDTRKCPHCAEWIKSEAVVCRYCGRDVTPTVTADTESQGTDESETPEETSTSSRKPLLFLIVGVVAVVIAGFVLYVLNDRVDCSEATYDPEISTEGYLMMAEDSYLFADDLEEEGESPEFIAELRADGDEAMQWSRESEACR